MKICLRSFYFIIVIIIIILCALQSVTGVAQADAPPGMILGRATMPDESTGIAGCEVQLLSHGDIVYARTTTDSEGNFIFTNVEPSTDTWHYRLIIKDRNWGQSVTQLFDVVSNSTTIVAVRVYPYIHSFSFVSERQELRADGSSVLNMTVALFDVNGKPVPDGVHVAFTQDSDYPNPGRFFAGEANGTGLTLATKGGRIVLTYGAVSGDTLSRGVRLNAECVESGDTRAIDITFDLASPNVIEGTVYDATGRTVPFASVALYRWDGVSKYVVYNRSDGSGKCDANGTYRFSVMPAGTYRVTANDSTFVNSSTVTVARGKYTLDVVLPMDRGTIHGWVKDNKGNLVEAAQVTLFRSYGTTLSKMAVNLSAPDGSFIFNDVWYGHYDVQAVYAGQTVDVSVILDESRTSVTLPLLIDASDVTPTPVPAKPTPGPGNASATPRPPTPTPPPVTPGYLISTYGVALGAMALVCAVVLLIVLRLRPK
ncbi:MAG: Cna protein B-type domain protein [Methanocella sp. PtaU1.Bin125]|nr:MAG: Cna protein B-type domain protein [Methanocella sp. PtaU1.Bin125]